MKSPSGQRAEQDKNSGPSTPFQENYISCPVCLDIEPHYAFKNRLFVERERDIDLRPTVLQWSVRGFEKFHPPLYYIFHCKKCHFAAGVNHYKDPLGEAGISVKKFRAAVKDAHSKIPEVKKVVKLLGEVGDDLREIDFLGAIRMHLLAIYNFHLVPDALNNDSLNLGRYCHRLAWLYRDLAERPDELRATAPKLARMFEKLAPLWPEVPQDEYAAQAMAVSFFQRALTNSTAVKSSRNEIEIILLISRIFIKLGDMKNSRRFLATARDKIRRMEELDRIPASESAETDAEKVQRHADTRIVSRALDELTNIFNDVRDEVEQAKFEDAVKFARSLDLKSPAEIQKRLTESGFEQDVISRVTELFNKRESKGLFGLFS